MRLVLLMVMAPLLALAGCRAVAGYDQAPAAIADRDAGRDAARDAHRDGPAAWPDGGADVAGVARELGADAAAPALDAIFDGVAEAGADVGVPLADAGGDAAVLRDAASACEQALSALDAALLPYRACTVASDCAYAYVPPCKCTTFLNEAPQKIAGLDGLEKAVLSACYPGPVGCPRIACLTPEPVCDTEGRCGAYYTP